MTGGISGIDKSDIENMTDIKKGLDIFLKEEDKGLASTPNVLYKSICKTLRASSQIVQGVLYRVAVEIVPVDIKVFSSGNCILKELAKPSDIKFGCFTIWSRPWLEDVKQGFIVDKQDSNDYKSCLGVNSY